MSETGFEIRGLNLRLGHVPVLRGVSFHLERGARMAVIGPNGAGKTSLIKCLARVLEPPRGAVVLDGRALERYSRRRLARWVGYVPQSSEAGLPFSVQEFVAMARYPHLRALGRFAPEDHEAVQTALGRTGAADLRDRILGTLSGGERQKVYIAAALAQEPAYLLLDEPTTFLDYKHQRDVLDLIDALHREQGMTVLTVTHDLNQGALTADRVLALRGGERVFCGPPEDLIAGGVLEDLYETAFDVVRSAPSAAPFVVPRRDGGSPHG